MCYALFLFMGFYMVIFNRFAADRGIEGQKKFSGIYPDDPRKAKRQTGLFIAGSGLFFIVTTVVQGYASPASLDIPAPGRILGGFGMLVGARHLVVYRRMAADLTTEQASEILRANISDIVGDSLVALFVAISVLLGAVLIVTGFQQL
jgi:hypothetical protein